MVVSLFIIIYGNTQSSNDNSMRSRQGLYFKPTNQRWGY